MLSDPTSPVDRKAELAYLRALRCDPCAYCGGRRAVGLDHIVPVYGDGPDGWENRTAACRACNSAKRARSLLAYILIRSLEVEIAPLTQQIRRLRDAVPGRPRRKLHHPVRARWPS